MSPTANRLPFITQLPRQDGCGGVVLQMLTGRSYAEIADMIGWRDDAVHYSRWEDAIGVLKTLGWTLGAPKTCTRWGEVEGLAVAHVRDDHFMIYDADNGLFYDPGEAEGPSPVSERIPMSFLTVIPPAKAS